MTSTSRNAFTGLNVDRLFPTPAAEPATEEAAVPASLRRGLFLDDGQGLVPEDLAHGPFDALHGGAIGGLLAIEAESLGREQKLGTPIGAHIQFLRPLKAEHRLTVYAEVAQPGRRLNLVDAFAEVDGALRVEARFTFARDQAIPGLALPPDEAIVDPERFEAVEAPHRPGRTWFKDALDWHPAPDGTMWVRARVPLAPDEDFVLPRVFAAADWAAGVGRPDGWAAPKAMAFPNPSLTVNLWRRPVGAWIGMKPKARWGASGFGMAEALLSDTRGEIGTASMPVILLPFPAA
ncbi:thioesterase family protein [Zavarzinia sp.]|uniref:thioesterase family protein n=1 Tax=Zavarzinia sp. TaxID=2027920 RepID=UPI0035690F25